MKNEFIPYEQALALKGLGFYEPCMYAWCITPEHRVEYDGKMFLKTDGNPFGQFYKGKNFNGNFNPNKNRIQCSAPTFSQSFRWFREKYNLDSFVKHLYKSTIKVGYYFGIDQYKGVEFQMDFDAWYDTYEEAELACLKKLIELSTTTTKP
jgi:hypothetical protein